MTFSRESRREYVIAALDKHERLLTNYAARMLGGDYDVARDVVQFTFMKLCGQDQKKSARQLKAWLYTVCRNRIIDQFRKNGRLTSVDPAHFEQANGIAIQTSAEVEKREWLEDLKSRIDELPEQDREIIDLWSHGLKHREIAQIVSKKPGTVRVQLHRLIQQLKKELGLVNADCGTRDAK